ncbi:molybdopterin-dependent oxidoreductase [Nocardioides sp. YIM 152315]|uniref:molybdopterin-dependent oxidoreductase n=1 Tax=Nocardioides sp. YIM 152315 TaxID=3031760 RepID=UPI0023DBAA0D|nr:molybdopterin-dependent oxidoreductase [Nocardioides sp. YIM 152315]MDF1604930.1 molybdopterin-dependent oxidoreductase [Nocardioides sp. YIM 152315]
MRTSRGSWSVAGLVAGFAGLAVSYCVAMVLTTRDAPLTSVAEGVTRLTPGPVVERAIGVLGHWDKPVLLLMILLLSAALFAWAGLLARRWWWAPVIVYAVLALVGGIAVQSQRGAGTIDLLPVAVGLATWLVCLSLLTEPLRRHEQATEPGAADPGLPASPGPGTADHTRRTFLIRTGVVVAGAVVLGTVGRVVGTGRRHVEEARRLLRLPGVTEPRAPAGVRVGVEGVTPWVTPADAFYRIDTAFVVPTIDPDDWHLRIHGMVDREVMLSYRELIARRVTQAWVTLNCVSNPVGGDLIGNAWWSGVRLADLLEEAGVQPGADAVLQTSDDGWTCGTPLAALTDDREAMLAVAMNGRPLPIDHGFPVRTIVPGLYGYVSACKWVVEMKVTRFADIEAYWTQRGWAEQGPVKIASRIDVPGDGGDVEASGGRVAGVAWAQRTGISSVEISVDDGPWQRAALGRVPSVDTWVQWAATLDVEPGEHTLAVRARDAHGEAQTGEVRDTVPDGATGWHTIRFEAKETVDG